MRRLETAKWQSYGERAAVWLFPRRCPFCDTVLGQDAANAIFCPTCAERAKELYHTPPRLSQADHDLSAVSGAASALCYEEEARAALLRCKLYGRPWYARELADLILVQVFGADPAQGPGFRPQDNNWTGLPRYHMIVPVPPKQTERGKPSLPLLLSKRLGAVFGVPVVKALHVTRPLQPQKALAREDRFRNVRGAYAAKEGMDLTGKRILLVDDIITTGATVSVCALALLEAGAADVFAVSVAADKLGTDKETRDHVEGESKR